MPLTPEHAAARLQGVGGSDLPAILHKFLIDAGDTVYGCPRALYFEKREIEADYPFVETGPVERGIELEPKVAERYSRETGHSVRRLAHKVSKENPWERVSIDRQIVGQPEGPGILECKTAGREVWYGIKKSGNPLSYVIQVLWGMHVLGPQYKWGIVGLLWADGWDFHFYPVQRDQVLIKRIALEVAAFWDRVEHKDPPGKLQYKDRRCQNCRWGTSCQGEKRLEAAAKDIATFEEIETDETLGPKVKLRMELKGIMDEAESRKGDVEAEIVEGMGKRQVIVAGGHKITHIPRPGGEHIPKNNMEKLKKDDTEIWEKYKAKRKDSQPLRFWPI